MKRAALIFVSIMLLFSSCCLGEEICGTIMSPGEKDPLVEFQIKQNDNTCHVHTNLFPKWIFCLDYKDPGEIILPVSADTLDLLRRIILQRWVALMNFQEVKGLFSSDLVECATAKKSAELSWGDLVMLFDIMEYSSELSETGIKNTSAWIKKQMIDLAENNPGIRFRTDIFDKEKAISISAVKGEGTIATFSARMEAENIIHIVLGSAENGRTYYRDIKAEFPKKQEMMLTLRAYADDQGSGYRTVKDNTLLVEESILIRGIGSDLLSLQSLYSFGPDQLVTGSITAEYKRTEEGKFSFDLRVYEDKNQDTENIRILVGNEAVIQSEWPAEPVYYDLMNPDASLTEDLLKEILENMGNITLFLLKFIPPQLMLLLNQ